MGPGSENQVVLCYAREDRKSVERFCETLQESAVDLPIVRNEVSDDATASVGTRGQIEASRFVVVFLSRQFAASDGIRRIDAEGPVVPSTTLIPVRLDDCTIPESLQHLQHVDLFEDDNLGRVVQLIKEESRIFVDGRDGQRYRTIDLGGKTWFARNLNYAVEDSWWYDDEPRNGEVFGRLYTWEAALTACPEGWHLAHDADWLELAASVGGSWMPKGTGSTETFETLMDGGGSGFNATLGGTRDSRFERFFEKMQCGYYWGGSPDGREVSFFGFSAKIGGRIVSFPVTDEGGRTEAFSCRCVKNSPAVAGALG